MRPQRQVGISTPLEAVRPIGDFVLVKPEPGTEYIGLLVVPEYLRMSDRGTRRGTVLACGPGDKAYVFGCYNCGCRYTSTITQAGDQQFNHVEYRIADCPVCGSSERYIRKETWRDMYAHEHRPMHVKPGDTVVFPRVPANQVRIDGEDLVFLHEQQHVLAVLEA